MGRSKVKGRGKGEKTEGRGQVREGTKEGWGWEKG